MAWQFIGTMVSVTISRSIYVFHYQFPTLVSQGGSSYFCEYSSVTEYTATDITYSTPHGIDLQDEAGSPCRTQEGTLGHRNLATIPVCRLGNCQDDNILGPKLIELWEQETNLSWEATVGNIAFSLNDQAPITANNFHGPSLGLMHLGWKKECLIQPYNSPPVPADALWLIWMCLREHWPAGGALFIGDPLKWPLRMDNFWDKLRRYVLSLMMYITPIIEILTQE